MSSSRLAFSVRRWSCLHVVAWPGFTPSVRGGSVYRRRLTFVISRCAAGAAFSGLLESVFFFANGHLWFSVRS